MSIIIDKEFESLIPPLTEDEFAQLEENCVRDGIRDPLVVWGQDGDDILVDGHNRFRIIGKHPTLQFNIKRMAFADRYEVKLWIIDNQLGKRNLKQYDKIILEDKKRHIHAEQAHKKMLSSLKQNALTADKKSCQRTKQTRQEQRENSTDYKIAKSAGVSEDTVRKVRAIEESGNEELKQQVRSGEKSIHRGWTDLKEKERRQADLSAKAHLEKAEERHKDFTESKTVSIADVAQDKKDSAEIARSRYNEIYNAIKKILFIGASNFDYSIINTKTMSNDEIRRLQGELNISIGVLKRIINEIGG